MIPNLPKYLDFANHRASATPADIESLAKKVIEHGFNSAFVNPCYVTLAKKLVNGQAKVGTVIAFPLGQETLATKIASANSAVDLGADELDVVPNLGTFLSGNKNSFLTEMRDIVDGSRMLGKPIIVKFILEPGYFDKLADKKEKMQRAALLIKQSGADFVKIGSGMGPRGPSVDDVKMVREAVGETIRIKVAGGITSFTVAAEFIEAGVNRIGTSHAVEIVTESTAESPKTNQE